MVSIFFLNLKARLMLCCFFDVTFFIICFLFRLLLHHFLFSSHNPSCFCCDCEYKIGNEIRHHRLTQRSSNSNRIPCANTSYSIPPWNNLCNCNWEQNHKNETVSQSNLPINWKNETVSESNLTVNWQNEL